MQLYQGVIRTFLIGLMVATAVPETGSAVTISFVTIDLADQVSGEDLWQYSYSVTDFTFDENIGFSVFFDPSLYTALEDPPPFVNADWDLLTLQPDLGLPADGVYDALALVNEASLADPFLLTFVWLGSPATPPGSQPFEINRFDAEGTLLETIEIGVTVPEASTWSLVGSGILLLAVLSRHAQM